MMINQLHLDGTIHIVPLNDIKQHVVGLTCKCGYIIEKEEQGKKLIVHKAYDCREKIDQYVKEIEHEINNGNIPDDDKEVQAWLSNLSNRIFNNDENRPRD